MREFRYATLYHRAESVKQEELKLPGRINSVDIHPDDSDGLVTFVTGGGGRDDQLRIWLLAPGAEAPEHLSSLRGGHTTSVNCARFSPDGSKLCSAGDRGIVCVWSGRSTAAWWRALGGGGAWFGGLLRHDADVYDVCWSPCGTYVLSGSIDGVATVWHADTRRPVKVLRDHEHFVQGVAWDPLGTCFATASADRTVKVYPVPDTWSSSDTAPKTVRSWVKRALRRGQALKPRNGAATEGKFGEDLFSPEDSHPYFKRGAT